MTTANHRIRQVLGALRCSLDGLSDGELLARFVTAHDEAAFARLVRIHGPMVLSVCRRVLQHADDSEDAFQATFLILARKAHAVVRRDAVGGWLYRVAYRTAQEARAMRARRRAVEVQADQAPEPAAPATPPRDWREIFDEELGRLPAKYQSVVVLCDLEGRSRREASQRLGIPEGTVSSRLVYGRKRLAARLARRGVTVGGGAMAAALAPAAVVSAALIEQTATAAAHVTAGNLTAVSTPVAILMKGVLKAMLMMKLKALAGILILAACVIGVGGVVFPGAGAQTTTGPLQKALNEKPGKPANELEGLRRENELLRLNLQVTLEKLKVLESAHAAGKEIASENAEVLRKRRQAAIDEVHAALKRLTDARNDGERWQAGAALDQAVGRVKREFGIAPKAASTGAPAAEAPSPNPQTPGDLVPSVSPVPGTTVPPPGSIPPPKKGAPAVGVGPAKS